MKNILILIKLTFLFLLFGCKEYNFTYYSDDDNEILIKGELDKNNVPNGSFVFYNDDGSKKSKGQYELGIKKGEWIYYLNDREKVIFWNDISFSNLRLPLFSDWKWENYNDSFYAYKIKKDSSLTDKFVISEHELNRFDNNFSKFNDSYKNRLIDEIGVSGEITDISKNIINRFDLSDVAMYRSYKASDNGNKQMIWFVFLIRPKDCEKVIEVSYVTEPFDELNKHKMFNEILIDIYYEEKLLLEKRWVIVN